MTEYELLRTLARSLALSRLPRYRFASTYADAEQRFELEATADAALLAWWARFGYAAMCEEWQELVA